MMSRLVQDDVTPCATFCWRVCSHPSSWRGSYTPIALHSHNRQS